MLLPEWLWLLACGCLFVLWYWEMTAHEKTKEQLRIAKHLWAQDKLDAITLQALINLFGADFRQLVRTCEHTNPEKLREFVSEIVRIYETLKEENPPSQLFDRIFNERVRECQEKFGLRFRTYARELGSARKGLAVMMIVVACPKCVSQTLDLAVYSHQLLTKPEKLEGAIA